jgi:hypothetical protein
MIAMETTTTQTRPFVFEEECVTENLVAVM